MVAEGHPDPEALCPPSELAGAVVRVSRSLREAGVDVPEHGRAFAAPGFAGLDGVRRLDCTVDVQLEPHVGLAVMAGIAALDPGRGFQVVVTRQAGGPAVETVAWRARRGIVARVYDKGVEASIAPRGARVRLEAQRRWQAGARPDPLELTAAWVRDRFERRFAPLWKASKGVRVMGPNAIAHHLRQLVADGVLSPGRAVDAAGYLFLEQAGVHVGSRATRYRHRSILQEAGIVLDPCSTGDVEVDLQAVLEEALETDAWERRG